MSKIQEALAKLQKSGAAPQAPIGRLEDTQQRKVIADPRIGGPVARSDRQIVIDRDVLRKSGFLVPEKDTQMVSEAFRRIKRPLIANMDPVNRDVIPRANIIAISSARSGEGKTFTCINLAVSIAQEQDLSMLLVDGDLLKPQLSGLFGAENEPGLMDLLTDPDLGLEDTILETDIPGFSFLPAGKTRQLTAELLGSRRMERLVELLSKQDPDRVVIFDTSPVLLASDAVVLTGHAGQVAVVVKAGATLKQDVQEAVEAMDSDKPVNLILNQARLRSDSGGYGYYGYGHAAEK